MPVYMDRHEMAGATAKAVADAHQVEVNPETVAAFLGRIEDPGPSAYCSS